MSDQPDLFSAAAAATLPHRLDARTWPADARFPFNRASASVHDHVWRDLLGSSAPLLIAGYSSIGQLVDFVASWSGSVETASPSSLPDAPPNRIRVLVGAEPFGTTRTSFGSATIRFTDEVRTYWLEERGISIERSARVLHCLEALKSGRLEVRCLPAPDGLHAKLYVGDRSATLGSSNFTTAGLRTQVEANVRFHQADEPERLDEARLVAENLWSVGEDWNGAFARLLEDLLQLVGWEQTLARACVDLLEGDWADRYLRVLSERAGVPLWPSQRSGIAQALWVIEQVGSVLVADATGSGKTRMGAHLVRAIRDRLWSTGRARSDLTVLVCPPAVESIWRSEALRGGLSIDTVSHGLLSRAQHSDGDEERVESTAVRHAQVLAIDEAHNFLNAGAQRSRQLRQANPEHVCLFTATPINRGASDLLALVGLLGADNFTDETLAILDQLERRRGVDRMLAPDQLGQVRTEIQRFTVRRTKSMLNAEVDRDPDGYRDPVSGRPSRYPAHDARPYPTGESPADEEIATEIRAVAGELLGLAQLEARIAIPAPLRAHYHPQRWLDLRAGATSGLAVHHVLAAMRSSRAALSEHLVGTETTATDLALGSFKPTPTGNVISRLRARANTGPPELAFEDLDDLEIAPHLVDGDRWREACLDEAGRYERIALLAAGLSSAREDAKIALLLELADRHARVLAFDGHLITLAVLTEQLRQEDAPVIMATGSTRAARDRVERDFARGSSRRAIALCSDALNEGINLQGASAVAHLDLPTTLRVAEQRVGRVDRMDSPHAEIEVYWPRDGLAFATTANEHLARRAADSSALLGSNLIIPDAITGSSPSGSPPTQPVPDDEPTWDGLRDALDPVRHLIDGPDPLLSSALYESERTNTTRIRGRRLSVTRSPTHWAFVAVAGTALGAPRWMWVTRSGAETDLALITSRLRATLDHGPPTEPLDDRAGAWLADVVAVVARTEQELLPRRQRRALDQLARTTAAWAVAEAKRGDELAAARWRTLRDTVIVRDGARPEPHAVADAWLALVAPRLEAHRVRDRRARYTRLDDITPQLISEPLSIDEVESALSGIPSAQPVGERISSAILGVPGAGSQRPRERISHRGSR